MYWPTPARNETEIMGYTIRTDEWRYTCWFEFDTVLIVPKIHNIIGQELYDHREDTGEEIDWKGEHFNLAKNKMYVQVVNTLHEKILNYIQLRPIKGRVVNTDADINAENQKTKKIKGVVITADNKKTMRTNMKGKSEMDGYTNLKQFHQVTSVCSTCSVPLPNGGLRVTHATLSIATPLNTIEKCAQKCLSVPQQKCISFSYLGSAAAPTECQLYSFSEQYTVVVDAKPYQYYLRNQIPTVAPLASPSKKMIPNLLSAPTKNVVLGSNTVFAKSMEISIDYLLRHYEPNNMLYWFRHRANLPQPKNAAPQGWDRCVNNIRGSHSHLCLKGSVASTFMMGAGGHLRWNENVELRQRLDQGKE